MNLLLFNLKNCPNCFSYNFYTVCLLNTILFVVFYKEIIVFSLQDP